LKKTIVRQAIDEILDSEDLKWTPPASKEARATWCNKVTESIMKQSQMINKAINRKGSPAKWLLQSGLVRKDADDDDDEDDENEEEEDDQEEEEEEGEEEECEEDEEEEFQEEEEEEEEAEESAQHVLKRPAAASVSFSYVYGFDFDEKVAWRQHMDDSKLKDVIPVKDLEAKNGEIWASWPTGSPTRVCDIDAEQLKQMQAAQAAVTKKWSAMFNDQRVSVVSTAGGSGLSLKIGKAMTCQTLFSKYETYTDVENRVRKALEKLGQEFADGKVEQGDLKERKAQLLALTFTDDDAGGETNDQKAAAKRDASKPPKAKAASKRAAPAQSEDAEPPTAKQKLPQMEPETKDIAAVLESTRGAMDAIAMFDWEY
jgi:hypothetical protein